MKRSITRCTDTVDKPDECHTRKCELQRVRSLATYDTKTKYNSAYPRKYSPYSSSTRGRVLVSKHYEG